MNTETQVANLEQQARIEPLRLALTDCSNVRRAIYGNRDSDVPTALVNLSMAIENIALYLINKDK